jgi:hypothetical protein
MKMENILSYLKKVEEVSRRLIELQDPEQIRWNNTSATKWTAKK